MKMQWIMKIINLPFNLAHPKISTRDLLKIPWWKIILKSVPKDSLFPLAKPFVFEKNIFEKFVGPTFELKVENLIKCFSNCIINHHTIMQFHFAHWNSGNQLEIQQKMKWFKQNLKSFQVFISRSWALHESFLFLLS